jgi:hypothetical protein
MSAAGESGLCIFAQHVRERQRIAEVEAKIDALRRQAVLLGAEPLPTSRRRCCSE